jgi:hypothetical protein
VAPAGRPSAWRARFLASGDRRDQSAPDGLNRYCRPDAQRHVGDPAEPALDRDVRSAPGPRLELVEGEAVVGMDDAGHRGPAGGHPAERSRLGGVRMGYVETAPAEQAAQRKQGPQIVARSDRGAQGRLDDHFEAGRRGLIEQVVAAAGDDRYPEAPEVERLRAAQREHAGASLQPGDQGGDPQRPAVHRAQPAEAAEASRDQ